MGKSDKNTAK